MIKPFKTPLILIFLFALACSDQGNEITVSDERSKKVIESTYFKSLNLSTDDLLLSEQPLKVTTATGKEGIVINFKDNSSVKKLMGFFDRDGEVIGVYKFEVESAIQPNKISNAIENGSFNGNFIFESANNRFTLVFENSKQVFSNGAGKNGRAASCNSLGDAYECTANSIASDGFFERMLCYAEIIICMGVKMADCLLEGCPIQ